MCVYVYNIENHKSNMFIWTQFWVKKLHISFKSRIVLNTVLKIDNFRFSHRFVIFYNIITITKQLKRFEIIGGLCKTKMRRDKCKVCSTWW